MIHSGSGAREGRRAVRDGRRHRFSDNPSATKRSCRGSLPRLGPTFRRLKHPEALSERTADGPDDRVAFASDPAHTASDPWLGSRASCPAAGAPVTRGASRRPQPPDPLGNREGSTAGTRRWSRGGRGVRAWRRFRSRASPPPRSCHPVASAIAAWVRPSSISHSTSRSRGCEPASGSSRLRPAVSAAPRPRV